MINEIIKGEQNSRKLKRVIFVPFKFLKILVFMNGSKEKGVPLSGGP